MLTSAGQPRLFVLYIFTSRRSRRPGNHALNAREALTVFPGDDFSSLDNAAVPSLRGINSRVKFPAKKQKRERKKVRLPVNIRDTQIELK